MGQVMRELPLFMGNQNKLIDIFLIADVKNTVLSLKDLCAAVLAVRPKQT